MAIHHDGTRVLSYRIRRFHHPPYYCPMKSGRGCMLQPTMWSQGMDATGPSAWGHTSTVPGVTRRR